MSKIELNFLCDIAPSIPLPRPTLLDPLTQPHFSPKPET